MSEKVTSSSMSRSRSIPWRVGTGDVQHVHPDPGGRGWDTDGMGAVLARLRGEARARLWSWVALAVLVGVTAGAVLAIAAGARRTDSSYSRFLATHAPSDFLIGDSSDFGLTGV